MLKSRHAFNVTSDERGYAGWRRSRAMADDTLNPGDFIASQLDPLFRTVHPANRGPYSIAEVVSVINASGGRCEVPAVAVESLAGNGEMVRDIEH
jgi:hypothetical protein